MWTLQNHHNDLNSFSDTPLWAPFTIQISHEVLQFINDCRVTEKILLLQTTKERDLKKFEEKMFGRG